MKSIELPDKSHGQLDFTLTWKPPRPGLQLSFDVFNQWNEPVVQSKKDKGKSRGRIRTATIDNARGKYFVRIYAKNRGDAGTYQIKVSFKEQQGAIALDMSKIDIPDPPKLAAVPEPEIPCDEFTFDIKNPACKSVCPQSGAPQGWPPCAGKCPTPPDINVASCLATMPCPNPPDRRVRACGKGSFVKCPGRRTPTRTTRTAMA